MDKARTGVGGDMLGSDEGTRLGEEAAKMMHGVAGDGSGELGAFTFPQLLEHRGIAKLFSDPDAKGSIECISNQKALASITF